MTQDDLATLTSQRLRGALVEMVEPVDRPFGLAKNEVNAAMLRGIVDMMADFVACGVMPTEQSRAIVLDWIDRELRCRVALVTAEGSA